MNDEEYRLFVERQPLKSGLGPYTSIINTIVVGMAALYLCKGFKKGK